MFVFRKAAHPTLSKLDDFLDETSPELVRLLTKLFEGQRGITFAELESAVTDGFEAELSRWREDYARFVNDKLTPIWLEAMRAL